jgi:hypothetical protein
LQIIACVGRKAPGHKPKRKQTNDDDRFLRVVQAVLLMAVVFLVLSTHMMIPAMMYNTPVLCWIATNDLLLFGAAGFIMATKMRHPGFEASTERVNDKAGTVYCGRCKIYW